MVGRRILRDRPRPAPRGPGRPPARPPRAAALVGGARGRRHRRPRPAWIDVVQRRSAARLDGRRRHPRHRRRAALPAVHRRPAGPPVARVPRGQGARAARRGARRRRQRGGVLRRARSTPTSPSPCCTWSSPDIEVEVRRPIVLEHSNSSVVFDEAHILKVLRKVEPGPNPDVEIPRVLAERGFEHVLPPLAELRRDDMDLAVLRDFLVGATEGWQLARASVRDVLASRLSPGGERRRPRARLRPGSARTIAALHVAMADAWGERARRSPPRGSTRWLGGARRGRSALAGAVAVLDVDAVRARLDEARQHRGRRRRDPHPRRPPPRPGDPGRRRVAGARLRGRAGPPPRRPLHPSSPLRDVAGHAPLASTTPPPPAWPSGTRATTSCSRSSTPWEERNRDAFLTAYYAEAGIDALLPVDPAGRAALLTAFELDKAVYELGYELGAPARPGVDPAGGHRPARRAGAVPS